MTEETGPCSRRSTRRSPRSAPGRMVIVVDDADRENEGDFIMAAEKATPESLNFMVTHGRGIVCMPMTPQRLDELRIPLMVSKNNESHGTAFAVSIDIHGRTTTGTSAFDRAATVRAITDPTLQPEDIRMPGHVFPLMAQQGGVLKRAGPHRGDRRPRPARRPVPGRGAVRGAAPGRLDGAAARARARRRRSTACKLISIADLIEYRRHREQLVARTAEAQIPTEHGEFTAHTYESLGRRDGPRRARAGRGRRRRTDPGARALGMPDRRRVRLDAVRLRRPARTARSRRSARRAAGWSCTSGATRAARSA